MQEISVGVRQQEELKDEPSDSQQRVTKLLEQMAPRKRGRSRRVNPVGLWKATYLLTKQFS